MEHCGAKTRSGQSCKNRVMENGRCRMHGGKAAWRKIIARHRQKPRCIDQPFNRVSAYLTPEGFRFAYETWESNPKADYVMVQAATASNPFLPDDYVDLLRESYPAQLTEVRDTPEMARFLKERFKDRGHQLVINPDASGKNTSSKNASESGLTILKQAGFTVRVNSRNPGSGQCCKCHALKWMGIVSRGYSASLFIRRR